MIPSELATAAATAANKEASANRSRMLIASELAHVVERFFASWDATDLTFNEAIQKLARWFLSTERRRVFDELLTWSSEATAAGGLLEKFKVSETEEVEGRINVDLLYGPFAPGFRAMLRVELHSDFSERFREARDLLSALAWLRGVEERRSVDLHVGQLTDALGL